MEKEEKVQSKPKYSIFYWIVVFIGVIFIVFMSIQIGDKLVRAFAPTTKGQSNKNLSNNSSTDNQLASLTEEEALKIGTQLWNYGVSAMSCEKFLYEESNGRFEIINFNEVNSNFTENSKVSEGDEIPENFENYFSHNLIFENDRYYTKLKCNKIKNSKYIATTLKVKNIEPYKISFSALSSYCSNKVEKGKCVGEPTLVVKSFTIKREKNKWKIDELYLPY